MTLQLATILFRAKVKERKSYCRRIGTIGT